MSIRYLEIVTPDVHAQCKGLAQTHGIKFDGPVAELGNAMLADLPSGGQISVRAPMHETEDPVTRPYFLCDDIEKAVKILEESGAEIIHAPLELPGHGTFAIYVLGGNQQGLWQD